MPEFEYRSTFPVPRESLYAWHARPGAFERLQPPWENIRIIETARALQDGERVVFQLIKRPFKIRWEALLHNCINNEQFTDIQTKGPFRKWEHTHRFDSLNSSNSELTDIVEYVPPLRTLEPLFLGQTLRQRLQTLFRFRERRLHNDLKQHGKFQTAPQLKIAVSGAGGMIGSQLCAYLQTAGHKVYRLTRPQSKSSQLAEQANTIFWDPSHEEIEANKLNGIDAVIHLAGENIAGLWTKAKKERISNSRVQGTTLLAKTLTQLPHPPKTLISASAIGYYGNRDDEELTEASGSGEGFLAGVCREWEEAARIAQQADVRVVNLRIGVVISALGGVLSLMRTPFLLGLGGPLGNGRGYFSWIALDDLLGLTEHLLHNQQVSGPVNAVAPHVVTNRELTKTLANVLKRPAVFTVPEPAIKTLAGDMGREMLLASARVLPQKAQSAGYQYLFPQIEEALRFELGRFD